MRHAESKRCLVVGGGFVGGHVARRLANAGHRVTIFSRGINPWLAERSEDVDVVRGTVETDGDVLGQLVRDTDVVLHFASSSKPPAAAAAPATGVESSITPAVLVLQAVADAGGGRTLVLASSGGTVYGAPDVLPTPESHPLRPSTPYAIAHVAVEHYAEYFAQHHGVASVIVRLANVYGPGELGRAGQGVIGTWLACAACGDRATLAGSLEIARDYVYAEDAAEGIRLLVECGARGTFNIGSSTATSLQDVLASVVKIVGSPLELALDTSEHATAHVPRTQLDCSRLRVETGWHPEVTLSAGIERTWDWTAAYLASGAPVSAFVSG